MALVALAGLLATGLVLPAVRTEIVHVFRLLRSADVTPIREYILSFGVWAPAIAVALHVGTSVVAPLPSFVPTFASAMVFGWIPGAILSWSASLIASGICFLIAGAYGRPAVELVVPRRVLDPMDRFFERWGTWSILIARLTPVMSFDFISYGAGLTSMKLRPFLIFTGLGMAPATLVFSYLAARGTTNVIWLLYAFAAAALLAALAAAVRPYVLGQQGIGRHEHRTGDRTQRGDQSS